MRVSLLASLISSTLVLAACNNSDDTPATLPHLLLAAGTKLDLAVLQTTDLHANVLSYDYYKTTDDTTLGFERTATLIDTARKRNQTTCWLMMAIPSKAPRFLIFRRKSSQ